MNPIQAIHTLVETLAHMPAPPDTVSLYSPTSLDNDSRRANLTRYLLALHARQAQVLMVMEAPGYRGCRVTGVPVTSRKVMLEGVRELDFFGEGYSDTHEPPFLSFYSEQSATIVWAYLAQVGILPIIWNTFPFHPHKPDNPLSNRAPRASEIALGLPFLAQILAIFAPKQVISVGNVAHGALETLSVAHTKVRHPAQGGKHDFITGMNGALGVG
jgi:uracil-DNA glycosylase